MITLIVMPAFVGTDREKAKALLVTVILDLCILGLCGTFN